MVAWCKSPDAQPAKDEVEIEIKRHGWHLLSRTSAKSDLAFARAQKHKFVLHLVLKYPLSHKEAPSWLQFISTQTGQLKNWNSVSASYTQASNKTHNTALKDAWLSLHLLGRAMLGQTVVAAIIYGFVGTDQSNDLDHFAK